MKRILAVFLIVGSLLVASLLIQCNTLHNPKREVKERTISVDTVFGPNGQILYIKKHHSNEFKEEVYLYSIVGLMVVLIALVLYGKK